MSFFKSLARASLVASDLEDVIAVDCADGRRITLHYDGDAYVFSGAYVARAPAPRSSGQFGRMFQVVCDAAVDFSGALAWRVV
jgi:hypothetical protein